MQTRPLGRSGLQVSPLCLGTMMFGDRTDLDEAKRIVDSARDHGVNWIDTADVYAKGESERITGRLIAQDRDRWVLATKVGNAMGDAPMQGGLSRRWIHTAIDASLQRLGVDHVDVYYLHFDDVAVPLEETVDAIGDVIRAGKALHFGLSNFRGWRIAEVMHLCRTTGTPKPVVLQPYYNAMNRMPEVELLPACDHYGIGVNPYSPLARGVLTGKYTPGSEPPADSRAGRKDKRMMETEFRAESLLIAQKIAAHAATRGLTPGQFAIAWVLANRIVSSVIGGPRTLEQWNDYYAALDYRWQEDDEALVDSLVAPGHPSTPGYSDPRYPFFGRRLG
ncbi:MAG: aldo/keto reductase [Burkholderiales bacterium]|jgi:aryl-alcohol dehydrogenase (NADP+)|nr:aldo/keto reductase [Burkholderiales bacterium]